jgi:hypothetical protein
MMISVRTARAAIILCGFLAAIAPIDTGWTQAICKVRMTANPAAEAEGKVKITLNGLPATEAQVEQCHKCEMGEVRGSACAAYTPKGEAAAKKAEEKTAQEKAATAGKNKASILDTATGKTGTTNPVVPLKKK